MGYQVWDVAYGVLEASKYDLIRPVAPVAKGHGAKSILALEAKVGSRPCCVQAAHFAPPTSFKLGAYSPLEELGMQPWAEEGPWEDLRLAAANYHFSLFPTGEIEKVVRK